MSHDDILDDMSLSDDDLLDSLADDMLMEMESEQQTSRADEHIPTIEPVRRAAPSPMGFPLAPNTGAPRGMPDLSQMMSQMMPMMSQLFNNGGPGAPNMGMRGNSSIQQQQLSWDELVQRHVPANEQQDWIQTIEKDYRKQRDDVATKRYAKPPSRSYHGNVKPLPNVYMEVETLLASLVNEGVRSANAEHDDKWKQYHDNLVSHLTKSGLAAVYTRELKAALRRRVEQDEDYKAARAQDPSRFSNIASALAV
ncbi:hypothetical protein Poli38472_001418 [Pythium oligandrum]|uniref:Uncharacterized protein n=1 Tax=Pythium oligandrum TaxID=41045 RepID=A0A8K1CSU5_PYTOL|nr:hypothetical protein Poli38472_001418 [Pythium oligandrum]|eukprot:TMW69262.1 hypothetical protein Poli38472_001418 [Pythium oligandrum]